MPSSPEEKSSKNGQEGDERSHPENSQNHPVAHTPKIEFSTQDDDHPNDTTPQNTYLSPDGDAPRRILSSTSLVGEGIDDDITSTPSHFRRASSGAFDADLSPFTPTSQEDIMIIESPSSAHVIDTTRESITPPLSIQEPPASLSPPLFTNYRSSDSITEGSLSEPKIQPSPQPRLLQPRTHLQQPIGYQNNKPNVVDNTLRAASAQLSGNPTARPFQRPPRAPASLQSSPYRNNNNNATETARLNDNSTSGHSRIPTDSTNFTFLSALTDASGEYGMPRRRTQSWDNNEQRRQQRPRSGSRGNASAVEQSPGGSSMPASILQPILSEETAAPPVSILASNMKKPTPAPLPNFLTSSASITEGMMPPMGDPSMPFQPTLSSSSITEGMTSQRAVDLPTPSLMPKALHWRHGLETQQSSNSLTFLSPDTTNESRSHNKVTPLSETVKVDNHQTKHYKLKDVLQASHEPTDETDVIRNVEQEQRRSSSNAQLSSSLLPQIDDDRVHDFQADEASNQTGRTRRGRRESTVESISDLTRKLMAANVNSPQRSPVSSTIASGGKSPTTTTQRTRYGRDQYYNDAERMYPTRKISFDSTKSPEDVEKAESAKIPNEESDKNETASQPGLRLTRWRSEIKEDVFYFLEFWKPRQSTLWKMFQRSFWFIMFPSLAAAMLLFYVFENPPTGRASEVSCIIDDKNTTICETPEEKTLEKASASWWLLFLGCRQVVTFGIGRISELIIINFFVFRTRAFPRMLGTTVSLALAQSKGSPYMIFSFGLFNLILNYGDRRFARHWLYWQDLISLMNEDNPSGDVTDDPYYRRLIYIAICVGIAVTIKRTVMGRFIGRRVVDQFRLELSKLMKRLLILQEIAALSVHVGQNLQSRPTLNRFGSIEKMYVHPLKSGASDETSHEITRESASEKRQLTASASEKVGKSLSTIQEKIAEVLDDWDEPVLQDSEKAEVTTTDVLQFRRALEFIDNEYPFSASFGLAATREDCIESSQQVFDRLTKRSVDDVLDFELLCRIAELPDGTTEYDKVRTMIKIFCPNRQGKLTKIDFVRSTDSVYKNLRLLLANIKNSSQIDHAYERLVNVVFYIVCAFVILATLGVDINALFLGLSGLLVSFAFMIGTASSKYLEGILLILVRKPYDIGDRVCFVAPTAEVNNDGPPSGGYIVEKVDLFTTTVRLATTREYTTFANGSLADSRIINLKRSDKANVFFYLKFTINSNREQLRIFRRRIMQWVEDRPREWIKLNAFRCLRVQTEMQYIEYVLNLQHREPWQNYNAVQNSKSDVFMFALDLQKELNMNYTAPRMPVDLHGVSGNVKLPIMQQQQDRAAGDLGFGPDDDNREQTPSTEPKKTR